jgi:phage-related protein
VAEQVGALSVSISMDTTGFATSLSQLSQQLKVSQTSMQSAVASLGGFGASTDALKAQAAGLSDSIAVQSQRVAQLNEMYQASVEAKGADDKATQNLLIRYNQANTALATMQNELTATNEKLALNNEEMEAAPSKFSSLTEGVNGAKSALGNLQNAFMGVAMAVAGAMGISTFVNKTAEAGANIEKLSATMGVSVQEASKLNVMFDATGVSGTKVASTLDRLDKSLLTASASGNATTRALDTFGVSLRNADGQLKSVPDQLQALADGYQRAAAAGQAQAYSSTVLGARAQQLIPLFQSYNAVAQQAAGIKTIWTPELAAGALGTEEALKEMSTQISQCGQGIAATLMPMIKQLAENITNLSGNIVTWLQTHQRLAETIAAVVVGLTALVAVVGAVSAVVTAVTAVISVSTAVVTTMSTIIPALATAWDVLTVAIGASSTAWEALNLIFTATPIGVIIAAIVALGVVVIALVEVWRNNWGDIQERTKAVGGVIAALFTEMVDSIEEGFDEMKQFVYDCINAIMNFVKPAVDALGSVAPGLKAAFDSAHDDIKGKLTDLNIMIATTGQTAAEAAAQVGEAGSKVSDAFSNWTTPAQKAKKSTDDLADSADDADINLDNLGTTTGKVQTAEQQAATATSLLKQRLQILTAQADLATAANQVYGNKTAELAATEQNLTQQIDVQKQIVQDATDNYDKLVDARLQNTSAGLAAQLEMVNEEKTLADLQDKLDATTQSIKDQQTALENQGVAVKALADTYNTDMANALDTYTQKVADAEAKETTDIQNTTDAYTKSLTARTDALMDFSKIFDAVTSTTVNPGDLVTNLQEQVTQMEQWQSDLSTLSGKGVGTDMITQLQQLGVGSADQVHAMTQMTAQQLTQYVNLWRQKQTDANTEATNELTVQQQDMQQKIALIQSTTQSQLDQLKTTWQTETAKIQADTETKLTAMATAAKTQGQAFMDNLVTAIQAGFPNVQAILQQLQTMLAMVGTSTTGGTTGTTGQPLKHYAGGGAVGATGPAFLDKDEYVLNQPTVAAFGGMSAVQNLVASFKSGMAALSPGAMTPALAGAGNTYNSYYSITVNGNNPQQVLDYLDRQLARRGVKKV